VDVRRPGSLRSEVPNRSPGYKTRGAVRAETTVGCELPIRGEKSLKTLRAVRKEGPGSAIGHWRRRVASIVIPPMNPKYLTTHKLKDMKSRRIILNEVKDHLIPHLLGKTIVRDMWEALKRLFQSKNENRKMVLREKIRDTKMIVSNTMTTYLTWI
jgi:hypothetical protein